MEQRAPGHTVADDKIYRKGLAGLQADIDRELAALDYLHDLDAYDKRQQLRGMRMAADAVIRFARRHAEEATRLAAAEADPARKARARADRGQLRVGARAPGRARSGRRCRRTGSCTSASSPS